jgi:hypothetical protein
LSCAKAPLYLFEPRELAKEFVQQVSSRKIFQQKRGLFFSKWNYLPGVARQELPSMRQILPPASAGRQTSPGVFFLRSAKSMFKRI